MNSLIIPKKIALTTFGCRANQYDTAALGSLFLKNSFEIVDQDLQADVYVINSCAITAQAETEAHQLLRKIKRKNPNALTIVTGCAAQVNASLFQEEGANHMVGNLAKDQIVQLVSQWVGYGTGPRPPIDDKHSLFFAGGVRLPKHARSFLKIQDGCSQFCSFCIVPFARGLNRSVEPLKVMESLWQLREQGVEEVVLTGIHLGTYGRDLRPPLSLEKLLVLIADQKPVKRVRLSSVDPEEVSDELIDLLATQSLFCKHLHLPLQSGDDLILKKMRRRYSSSHFRSLVDHVSERMPDICLGTDVIVGFPGEDDNAFLNTKKILRETPIAYVHVFPYSERVGTKAVLFEGKVALSEIRKRVRVIRDLSRAKKHDFEKRFVGCVMEGILEKRNRGLVALTSNYLSVDLPGDHRHPLGSMFPVAIESVNENRLVGTLNL